MADIELATDLLEKLKVSMNKDHGDEPVDCSKNRSWNQTALLDELQTFLRISNDKHRVMETRTKRLATEIRMLHLKLEEERNKNKLLTEKMAQSATKEMDFFFKEKKVKCPDSEENKEKTSPPTENNEVTPDPQVKVELRSEEGNAPTAMAPEKQPEAEPCVYITRSELCRLEGDMAALLEVLRKREQTWERTKERERSARQKCITLAATAAKFSDMATHQRSEIETKIKQIEKMAIELSKYKGECVRLRRLITQVRKDTLCTQDSANEKGAASAAKPKKTSSSQNKGKTASKKRSKTPAEKTNERSGP